MSGRLSRSWELLKASVEVLRQQPDLMVLPIISLVASLLILACFALPVIGLDMIGALSSNSGLSALSCSVTFVFYICLYFSMFFFNSALIAAVQIRFAGGTPTAADGLRIAASKFASILGYAIVAATVGVVLRMIQDRVGFIGKIVTGLLGAAWTVTTFMVLPILINRDIGPVDAIKESAGLIKRTWGENIVGRSGIGLAFFFIYVAIVLTGATIMGLTMITVGANVALLIELALMLIAMLFAILLNTTLTTIYSAALYRYSSTGNGVGGFNTETLQMAFSAKKK